MDMGTLHSSFYRLTQRVDATSAVTPSCAVTPQAAVTPHPARRRDRRRQQLPSAAVAPQKITDDAARAGARHLEREITQPAQLHLAR